MKIYQDIAQGSAEWHELRARHFTASELGTFAVEPVKVTLTVDEIKAELDNQGIARKGITKRDDLLTLLPGAEAYAELCDGARTAIIGKVKQERLLSMRQRESLTQEESIYEQRESELQAQRDRSFEYNIPVRYGKELEPFARQYYEQVTGHEVEEVGLIAHNSGGFGCSPDGLVGEWETVSIEPDEGTMNIQFSDDGVLSWMLFRPAHGVEIKCPIPETHLAWLLAGTLPDCHKLQVNACMAVTGLDRWDFLSYCPGDAPLLITVERDAFTDQLEAGLKTLVAEKAKMKAKLAMLWRKAFVKGVES